MQRKSHFLALAEEEGLRSPKTIVLPAGGAFETAMSGLTYPIVVKADHSYGGLCVRIANDRATCALLRGSSRRPRDGEAFSDGFSEPC